MEIEYNKHATYPPLIEDLVNELLKIIFQIAYKN